VGILLRTAKRGLATWLSELSLSYLPRKRLAVLVAGPVCIFADNVVSSSAEESGKVGLKRWSDGPLPVVLLWKWRPSSQAKNPLIKVGPIGR
jgi:hypothetical protein